MMRNTIAVVVLAVTVLVAQNVFAQAQPFTVQANVPASSTATFNVSRVVPGTPEVFTPTATTNLDFGTLAFNTGLGIFLPAHFWVIDVGANGAGSPDIGVTYTDTANPNGALNGTNGLGRRGTIAYSQVVTNPNLSQTVTLIRGESLAQSNTAGGVNETAFAAGFLRVSVGIATGNVSLQEGNATPFTSLDKPGTYSGTVTLSATFD
jgi:hypothetical protein